MKIIDQNLVLRQYLSWLPENRLACPLMNYEEKKLTDFNLVKLFVVSTLCKWESLREIEEGIRSKKALQRELELTSISYSQISRRLIDLNTADLADLLGRLARHYWVLQRHAEGINPKVGILLTTAMRLFHSCHVFGPLLTSNCSILAIGKSTQIILKTATEPNLRWLP